MEIDIISYTDGQYAALNDEQIQEIRSAQSKKNALQRNLEKAIEKEKYRFTENGTLISKLWTLKVQELTATYEREVEAVRQALLFYLRFSGKPSGEAGATPSYPLDYSLNDEERFTVVKQYYMTTYTNAAERFAAFQEDVYAKSYLGELYAMMYDYLRLQE
ncbi:MAG: hypothetical protein IKA88_06535 [Clostridia bacterium]|nr:hypothetical protein [Clostridia bacterium]